ncbi:23S rRNA (guanine(745)-N(1))-methyltransferase [Shewanella yunxiaonensis]|uniref:23S rRNA (Guanine(745)-N(1))-methyltransferase n=1 Tax=Shewanella yunxiaonensis TaxID=2829809 RepID=A0ABX7YQH1_9GAMM|nr:MULTISPECIES: 23S rRNA (guanine(745)-N(1))-methyltransferase [Shewanella]MDF0533706.1 23S rRNA (guanine(745)-N(1))-methyltransferase [Shewanella sp. A32]QUN04594.1 23S rRNA (guanine(745)-N(1))-methyltransferase [Shewanella yunxiaonensis]
MNYECPICRKALVLDNKQWRCEQRHCFDVAKEGYVNLLPVNKKRSLDPGDNQQMMTARRVFLDAGYYQPLSDRINALAKDLGLICPDILDVGCGEGYYSQRLQSATNANLQGMDISKTAIRYAAKRYANLQFCVASAFDMPFADNSFDLLLKIFAPAAATELVRVCRPGGYYLSVTAGPMHHYALKEIIYDAPREHPLSEGKIPGFVLQHQERLQWMLHTPAGECSRSFLQMTPYLWKFTAEQIAQMEALGVNCELDFCIELFKRHI